MTVPVVRGFMWCVHVWELWDGHARASPRRPRQEVESTKGRVRSTYNFGATQPLPPDPRVALASFDTPRPYIPGLPVGYHRMRQGKVRAEQPVMVRSRYRFRDLLWTATLFWRRGLRACVLLCVLSQKAHAAHAGGRRWQGRPSAGDALFGFGDGALRCLRGVCQLAARIVLRLLVRHAARLGP